MTTTLPAELALEREPDLHDIVCAQCDVGPAEFVDGDGEPWCLNCADAKPEHHLERSEPWRIDDLDKAEWAMRKLVAINKKIADKETTAEAWMLKISEWLEGEVKPLAKHREFFEHHLEAYARELRERENLKTLKLPSGRVKSTRKRPRPQVVDEEQVVRFLEVVAALDGVGWAVDSFVRVQKSVVKAALKDLLDPEELAQGRAIARDGTELPGVVIEPEAVSYKVEVSE